MPATLDELLPLEVQLLGHARPLDVAFVLADRPGALLLRDGRPIGYAFAPNAAGYAGPVGTLEPADMPVALAYVENAAAAAGHASLDLTVPLACHAAVAWLLGERGFKVDPFYCLLLADGPWAKLDRYLPFNPCLFL